MLAAGLAAVLALAFALHMLGLLIVLFFEIVHAFGKQLGISSGHSIMIGGVQEMPDHLLLGFLDA